MDKRFSNLPLRKGVGVALLNKNNQVFVAKRIDNPKDFWQMPQGGIDKGETPLEAAFRELKEETNIKSATLIREINEEITYYLPNNLLGIIWKGKYKGQTQKWFIMKFLGDDTEIDLKTKHPEFLDWKWINIDSITDKVVEFKLLTHKDEREIDAEVLAYKKLSQATGVDNTLTTRLKKQIISVDGETEQSKINAFVDNQFLALDTRAFRDYVDSLSPDIELEYQYTSQIGEPHTVNVPMGVRFFWPESDR